MGKYEELYKHSKDVFEEELSRFERIEDKATKFITVVTSLLVVYALTGRQLFGSLFPANDWMHITLVVLAGLVLVGLLASWGFAFRALHIQGVRKAPLNDELITFFHENELVNIHYGMAKQYSASLAFNRNITNAKAANIKLSFWCIVATVAAFALFIGFTAANELSASTAHEITKQGQVVAPAEVVAIIDNCNNEPSSTAESAVVGESVTKLKQGVESMGDNENKPSQTEQPSNPSPHPERPDLDIVAPNFDLITESFDPSKIPENKPKE